MYGIGQALHRPECFEHHQDGLHGLQSAGVLEEVPGHQVQAVGLAPVACQAQPLRDHVPHGGHVAGPVRDHRDDLAAVLLLNLGDLLLGHLAQHLRGVGFPTPLHQSQQMAMHCHAHQRDAVIGIPAIKADGLLGGLHHFFDLLAAGFVLREIAIKYSR